MSPASDRIASTFARCKQEGRAALVTYVMGGDPDLRTSRAAALACAEGGADVLEIGIPFSDPIADGPTIQRAAERSLAKGTTLADCLELARQVRAKSAVPIALMGYVNPVLSYGLERFAEDAVAAGVDGVILPDLPPEEADELSTHANTHGLKTVFLLAPTSTQARCEAAFQRATGFIYFVSVTGVTGARAELPADTEQRLDELRRHSPVPVVVGFGISRPDQAKKLAAHADGVVVGSAIVSRIAEPGAATARAARVRRFVKSIRNAI